jgi:hypothetical protein
MLLAFNFPVQTQHTAMKLLGAKLRGIFAKFSEGGVTGAGGRFCYFLAAC